MDIAAGPLISLSEKISKSYPVIYIHVKVIITTAEIKKNKRRMKVQEYECYHVKREYMMT
jgi:hypothetical protein